MEIIKERQIYTIKMSYRNIRPCRKTDKLSDNLCGVDL